MKKLISILLVSIFAINFSYGQWTTGSGNINNTNSGNVGIGTSAPAYKLDVNGSVNGGASSFSSLNINNSSTIAPIVLSSSGYTSGLEIGTDNSSINILAYDRTNSAYRTFVSRGSYFTWNPSDVEKMRLDINGNLGIGTSSPTQLLDVRGGNIRFGDAANPQYIGKASDLFTGGSSTDIAIRSDNGNITFGAGGSSYSMFTTNGNLLINRTTQLNSTYKLDVNGYAHATEIVVNVSGADFVFNTTYKLRSLNSVANYINQNHHLPEMQSAETMQKDGLSLGENQTKLLQKVEELTLYLIKQHKEIQQLKNQIKTLKTPTK